MKPGDVVVCVDPSMQVGLLLAVGAQPLELDATYTIREFVPAGTLVNDESHLRLMRDCVRLVEVSGGVNPCHPNWEIPFRVERFRPILEDVMSSEATDAMPACELIPLEVKS